MKTALSHRQNRAAQSLLWIAVLACLPAAACFRSLDPTKLTCTSGKKDSCPSGYYCTTDGKCKESTVPSGGNTAGSSGTDASADTPVSSPDLGGGDTLGGTGGTAGNGATGGAGGTGGAGATGGAGIGGGQAGTGGTGGAAGISGTGGTAGASGLGDNGAKCSLGSECKSKECWDGVCCDLKCDGNCESCATGKCAFTSKPRKACAGSDKCAGICDKSNQKECTFDKTTICAAQSCSGGERLEKSICDGKGNCPAQVKTTCDPKQCKADGSDCATCTDEPSATTCAGGHCGPTANNCTHTVQCPRTCSGVGETCGGGGTAGFCGCTSATTSQTCGTSNCGNMTDNCGKTVSCGTCNGGSTCVNGTCCTPNCTGKCGGSDGCGGTCPNNCVSPQTCGGGGTPNVCGCTPNCNGKCGGANGCGGTCPDNCVSPQTCGGGGTPNVCGCTPNCSGKCGGANGCGGTCPDNCVSPQTCGGGGAPNVCGCTPNCSGKCGGPNGCGGTCPNNCVSPQTCGGGGTTNVCGCTPNCTNKCGVSDGCGGTCSSTCAAGRTCYNGTCCAPLTQAAACGTRNCGPAPNGDGCGSPMSCGTCPAGRTCNGSGQCQCDLGTLTACNTCTGWNFDSCQNAGLSNIAFSVSGDATPFSAKPNPSGSGCVAGSSVFSTESGTIGFVATLCNPTVIRSFSAQMYVDGDSLGSPEGSLWVDGDFIMQRIFVDGSPNQWHPISLTLDTPRTGSSAQFNFSFSTAGGSARVYFDNVLFQ